MGRQNLAAASLAASTRAPRATSAGVRNAALAPWRVVRVPSSMPKLPIGELGLPSRVASGLKASCPTAEEFLTSWAASSAPSGDGEDPRASKFGPDAASAVLRHIAEHVAPPVCRGSDLLQRLKDPDGCLPTGEAALGELLGGGYRRGQVTEIAGPSGIGKTQLCLYAAVAAVVAGKRVAVVDTVGQVSARRLDELMLERGLEDSGEEARRDALSRIEIQSAPDLFALWESLQRVADAPPSHRPDLVIVDTPSSLLAPCLGGPAHVQGRAAVERVGKFLLHLADYSGAAVLVTNHVLGSNAAWGSRQGTDREQGGAGGAGAEESARERPALGETWRRQVHVRVLVREARPGEGADTADPTVRVAEVLQAPNVPVGSALSFHL